MIHLQTFIHLLKRQCKAMLFMSPLYSKCTLSSLKFSQTIESMSQSIFTAFYGKFTLHRLSQAAFAHGNFKNIPRIQKVMLKEVKNRWLSFERNRAISILICLMPAKKRSQKKHPLIPQHTNKSLLIHSVEFQELLGIVLLIRLLTCCLSQSCH